MTFARARLTLEYCAPYRTAERMSPYDGSWLIYFHLRRVTPLTHRG